MVLGDGARDRGARCDEISSDPATARGSAFVRLEAAPDPVRVRAAFVSDDDIRAMAAAAAPRRDAVVPAADRGRGRMITGWLSGEHCPDCGGPLLDTSTGPASLTLACPGCGYAVTWHATDHDLSDDAGRAGDQEAHDPTPDQGTAARHAAGPRCGPGPGRRARRLPAAGPAAPHRPGHRAGRPGARALRAHPRLDLPSVRRTRQDAARGAVPRGLAPGRPSPTIEPDDPDDEQRYWVERRAETQADRDHAAAAGHDTAELDELNAELDEEITRSGMRGNVLPGPPARRHRSTRRRQDTPDLPRRPVTARTIGKTYTAPDGKTFRPSMFLTLTCDSYGRVSSDGTPADPGTYDYQRAARDALHFAALFDRFIQNLRRFLGYDVQYFAAIEPQRRLAPHVHIAIRGTVSRADLRQVLAATYHQVWWPSIGTVRHDARICPSGTRQPAATSTPQPERSCRPGTRRSTPSAPDDEPLHVARFGAEVRRPGRPGRIEGLGPLHRLPDQVPDQARRRMPPGRRPTRSGRTPTAWPTRCGTSRARRRARTGCATASSPRTPAPGLRPGLVQGQGPPPRASRLRRAPRPGLPQMVRQDPRRPPRRPQSLADGHARHFGNRPSRYTLGTRQPRRPRPHANCPTAPARRRRPAAMAGRARRSPTPSRQAKEYQAIRRRGGPHERPERQECGRKAGDELMTVAQMCAALGGVSRRTFYRWRELGVGPKLPEDSQRGASGLAQRLHEWLESLREGAA